MTRLDVDELFQLTPWRRPQMELSIYAHLEWTCAYTGRTSTLGQSKVALEGAVMRLLVCPPESDDFSVIKIKGLLRRSLITEFAAPSRDEINKMLDKMRELGVIQSSFRL